MKGRCDGFFLDGHVKLSSLMGQGAASNVIEKIWPKQM